MDERKSCVFPDPLKQFIRQPQSKSNVRETNLYEEIDDVDINYDQANGQLNNKYEELRKTKNANKKSKKPFKVNWTRKKLIILITILALIVIAVVIVVIFVVLATASIKFRHYKLSTQIIIYL